MDDSKSSKMAAFERAARRARWLLLGRDGLWWALTAAPTVEESYERTLSRIERRIVVVRRSPAPGRAGRVVAPPSAAGRDAWAVDGNSLPDETRVVTSCARCDGEKTVDCGGCSGRGVRRCDTCGGRGRVPGKGKRDKKCPSCRERGERKCEFCGGKGRVQCRECEGSGRGFAWLAVETSFRAPVSTSPPTPAMQVHRGLGDPADFDSQDWPHSLVEDTGPVRLDAAEARAGLPGLLEGLWPRLDTASERLISIRHQRFAVQTHRFMYANPFGEGCVDVSGNPPEILRSSDWGPLWTRLGVLALAAVGCLVGLSAVTFAYESRHVWFEAHGLVGLLAFVGLLTSVAAVSTLAVATSKRFGAWGRDARILGAVALAGVFASAAVWKVGAPSLDAARAAYERGELAEAALEADAYGTVVGESPARAELLDDIRLANVTQADDIGAAAQLLGERWTSDAKRAEAAATFRQRLGGDSDAARERGDAAALESMARQAGEVAAEEARELRTQAAELRISGCVASKDLSCVGAELDAVVAAGVPMGRLAQARDSALSESVRWVQHDLDAARGSAVEQRLRTLQGAVGVVAAYKVLACGAGGACRPSPARDLVAAEAVAMRDEFVQDRAVSGLSALQLLVQRPLPEVGNTIPWSIAKVQVQRALAEEAFDEAFGHLETAEAKGAPEPECAAMRAEFAVRAEAATAGHWKAAKSRDLEVRDAAYTKALAASRAYALVTGESTNPPASTIELAGAKNAEAMAKARAREAELQRRRAARAEAQRVAQAARAARAGAPLLCRDGSHSPSCTCSGSWSGCCSWHGGVRGCSQ